VENLRIYQMELQMQADELMHSQAQTQQVQPAPAATPASTGSSI
jgi:hypothetical protein